MKYFFDTEFSEHLTGIELISIGIVAEDGREFYAESSSFDASIVNSFVAENVIKKLWYFGRQEEFVFKNERETRMFGTDEQIKNQLLEFFHPAIDADPVFYAYFGAYDWVIFARLFGRLIDKPAHFPMWVIDIKQMMYERGFTKEWKRTACPDPLSDVHNALIDARWNKQLHEAILEQERKDKVEIKNEIEKLIITGKGIDTDLWSRLLTLGLYYNHQMVELVNELYKK